MDGDSIWITQSQRLKALEGLEKEYRRGAHHRLNREQIASLKPKLVKAFKLRSCRAFNVLQLLDRKSIPIEEKYQVPEEDILQYEESNKGSGYRAFRIPAGVANQYTLEFPTLYIDRGIYKIMPFIPF